jgi:hypothetical protein
LEYDLAVEYMRRFHPNGHFPEPPLGTNFIPGQPSGLHMNLGNVTPEMLYHAAVAYNHITGSLHDIPPPPGVPAVHVASIAPVVPILNIHQGPKTSRTTQTARIHRNLFGDNPDPEPEPDPDIDPDDELQFGPSGKTARTSHFAYTFETDPLLYPRLTNGRSYDDAVLAGDVDASL